MSYTLIISEKPAAARKIAFSISSKAPVSKNNKNIHYYSCERDGKEIVVCSAVGHLYGLEEKDKDGWKYPVFDTQWVPAYVSKKESSHTKNYIDTISMLAKNASDFVIACDYDIEGEVIGYNLLRFACKAKDAKRMKFSTLTKPDLIASFEKMEKTLNWGQAYAGVARHTLDWLYGINLSRALTLATKSSGRMKVMSIGRVQGPALRIVVEKEKDIKKFVAEKYYEIELLGKVNSEDIKALHEKGKIKDKEIAKQIYDKTKGKDGKVLSVDKKEGVRLPPLPFDLTTLQTESYRLFRINPKATLEIAQSLYVAGYTSYPRTSSQKLPPTIGYKKIIESLAKNPNYNPLCKIVLSNPKLSPRQGKKDDPAHPAIFPTGNNPKSLEARHQKVYDLIVKRFLATFGDVSKYDTSSIKIDLEKEIFVFSGSITTQIGWLKLYAPYGKENTDEIPVVKVGDVVINKKLSMDEKETMPPPRFSPSSLLKELEKNGLGTKATRASIIDTLFNRGYVVGNNSISATIFGEKTVEVLEKQCPEVVDVALTKHFETELEEISGKNKTVDEVLEEAKKTLEKILNKFKNKEKAIGEELVLANRKHEDIQNAVGKCLNCKDGTLMIKTGKFGRFIACNRYPECKTTFALPKGAMVLTTKNVCENCNYPMIQVIRARTRPQEVCINPDCPSKKNEAIKVEEAQDKSCPKCGAPLVLRKSFYGQFYGCSKYPNCKYIENIENNGNSNNKDSNNDSTNAQSIDNKNKDNPPVKNNSDKTPAKNTKIHKSKPKTKSYKKSSTPSSKKKKIN